MRVHYRRSAIADLTAIKSHIAIESSDAAMAVVRDIRETVERLALFPRSARRGSVAGTYELVVPGLPYIVVYTIEEDGIDIRAVFHAAQRRP